VVIHEAPERCDACQSRLSDAQVMETRQVFDLPILKFEVTEHRVMQAHCTCGKAHRGRFPQAVTASVQYGPKALAAMVHLNQNHMVPIKRTASLMEEFFGLPVSQGTVIKASVEAAQRLQPTVQAIGQALVNAPVVHADETGLRVAGALHWMHVLASNELTWVGCHPKRGGAAFEALGLLGQFKGTLIHDGWKPYRALQCGHGLCNAHHLRELTYVFEELGQAWAGDMIELLRHANHLDNATQLAAPGTTVDEQEVQQLRDLYEAILDDGDECNPRQSALGKPGRTKQSKPANLLSRLRQYADDVWRFITEPNVPFTNNVAEQTVRMPKVKQKISGCFRTLDGANTFCVIRSYLATMHKQGANLFDSLTQTFLGSTPQPRMA
jgi:transposase